VSGVDAGLAGGRVLVIGASSQVGRFVLPRLLGAGATVCALSRTGAPPGYPELDGLAWASPPEARACLAEFTHLVSAGPLAVALDYAINGPALRGVAATSTSSVLSKAASPDAAERQQVDEIREAEEGLRTLARERRLPLLVLRPTLVYGCGLDRNLTQYVNFIRRFGFLPVSTRSGGLRQPVHADDVAAALVAGLGYRDEREVISPLCGGDTVDYRGMLRRVFAALDRPPRLLALPPALFAGIVALAGALRVPGAGSPEMVRRQAINLVFDDRAAREALGVSPRRFRPGPQDFRPPDLAVLERLAGGR